MAKDYPQLIFSGLPSETVSEELWILDVPVRPLDSIPVVPETELRHMTAEKRRALFRIVKKAS